MKIKVIEMDDKMLAGLGVAVLVMAQDISGGNEDNFEKNFSETLSKMGLEDKEEQIFDIFKKSLSVIFDKVMEDMDDGKPKNKA